MATSQCKGILTRSAQELAHYPGTASRKGTAYPIVCRWIQHSTIRNSIIYQIQCPRLRCIVPADVDWTREIRQQRDPAQHHTPEGDSIELGMPQSHLLSGSLHTSNFLKWAASRLDPARAVRIWRPPNVAVLPRRPKVAVPHRVQTAVVPPQVQKVVVRPQVQKGASRSWVPKASGQLYGQSAACPLHSQRWPCSSSRSADGQRGVQPGSRISSGWH